MSLITANILQNFWHTLVQILPKELVELVAPTDWTQPERHRRAIQSLRCRLQEVRLFDTRSLSGMHDFCPIPTSFSCISLSLQPSPAHITSCFCTHSASPIYSS